MSKSSPFRQLLFRYRRGAVLAGLLATSSLLILFNGTPGVSRPQEIGLAVFSFFQAAVSQTVHWFGQSAESVTSFSDLKGRYDQVSERLKKFEGNERELVLLRSANQRLKSQVEFHASLSYFNVAAEIIGKDPSRVYASMVINKGYLDGIRQDQPVLANQNGVPGLVGKISRVSLTSAIVQPVLDANLFVSARMENSRNEGLVSGKGSNEEVLLMNFVKKRASSEISLGDLVVTSGLESLYPAEIVIGRVKSVNSKEYETSLNIEVEPAVDFSKLEYLFILKAQS
jgi:rod shape-determining protein MreC